MSAGRLPSSSLPLTGPSSTQAISPAWGTILSPQNIVQGDFAARVGVIDNFRAAIRTPVQSRRLILWAEPFGFGDHLSQQFFGCLGGTTKTEASGFVGRVMPG